MCITFENVVCTFVVRAVALNVIKIYVVVFYAFVFLQRVNQTNDLFRTNITSVTQWAMFIVVV